MLLIACAVALVFFYLWRRSRGDTIRSAKQTAFSFAEPWLSDEGIQTAGVRYETYFGRPYTLMNGTAVVVGTGRSITGEDVGFVAEIHPGHGLLSGKLLRPASVASWHRRASLHCLSSSLPLMTVLGQMADEHRKLAIGREISETASAMNEMRRIVAETEQAKAIAHEEIVRQIKAMTSGDGSGVADSSSSKQQHRTFDEPPSKDRIAKLRARIDSESRQSTKR